MHELYLSTPICIPTRSLGWKSTKDGQTVAQDGKDNTGSLPPLFIAGKSLSAFHYFYLVPLWISWATLAVPVVLLLGLPLLVSCCHATASCSAIEEGSEVGWVWFGIMWNRVRLDRVEFSSPKNAVHKYLATIHQWLRPDAWCWGSDDEKQK